MRNRFSLGIDVGSIDIVSVVTFLMRQAKRAVVPAVLSGVPTVISSAVAVLSVIAITPSCSSACVVAVPTFACTFRFILIAILRQVAVRVRRRVTAVIAVTCRETTGITRTFSAIFSPISTVIATGGDARSLLRCHIQRTLETACIMFVSSRTFLSGGFIANLHSNVGGCTSCHVFKI